MSAHLFFEDRPELLRQSGDRVILEIVDPLIRRCRRKGSIERYFFIRYRELGPHVRLRLQGDPATLDREVRPLLEEAARIAPETREDDAGSFHLSGHPALTHVRFFPYTQEARRYGGRAGTRVAESFFHASSDLALELLRDEAARGDETRPARALLAMAVLLHVFSDGRADAAELAHDYRRYALETIRVQGLSESYERTRAILDRGFESAYARQAPTLGPPVQALWRALDEGAAPPPPLAGYHASLVAVRRRLEALVDAGELTDVERPLASWSEAARMLTPSYLHMTNNRLGIRLLEESYLGHLAARLLEAPAEVPTSSPQKRR